MKRQPDVYLVHFDQRYAHAGHYTGSSPDIDRRLTEHFNGRGARLMAVIKDAGITWRLARVWPEGGRDKERALKQRGAARHCPICKGQEPEVTWTPKEPRQARKAEPAVAEAPRYRPGPEERGTAWANRWIDQQIAAGHSPDRI